MLLLKSSEQLQHATNVANGTCSLREVRVGMWVASGSNSGRYFCMSANLWTYWDTAFGSFFSSHAACYSPLGKGFCFLFQWKPDVSNTHALLCWRCCVIQSNRLTICHSHAHVFCTFHLSFSAVQQLKRLSQLQWCPVLAVSTSWCGCQYGFYAQPVGLLFSGFWVTLIILQTLTRFQVLCSYSHTGTTGSCAKIM